MDNQRYPHLSHTYINKGPTFEPHIYKQRYPRLSHTYKDYTSVDPNQLGAHSQRHRDGNVKLACLLTCLLKIWKATGYLKGNLKRKCKAPRAPRFARRARRLDIRRESERELRDTHTNTNTNTSTHTNTNTNTHTLSLE